MQKIWIARDSLWGTMAFANKDAALADCRGRVPKSDLRDAVESDENSYMFYKIVGGWIHLERLEINE